MYLTWNWSFGDGNISSLENPVYTYHTSGNYTVNLTANNTNSHGTKIEYINVSAVPPTPTPTLTPTPIITQHHGTPYNGGGQTGVTHKTDIPDHNPPPKVVSRRNQQLSSKMRRWKIHLHPS